MRLIASRFGMFSAMAFAVLQAATLAPGATLYTVRASDNSLLRIDSNALVVSVVGQLGVPFQMGDLAWDSSTNSLFLASGGGASTYLAKVDVATGAASVIGNPNLIGLAGLEFDSSTQTLYATTLGMPGDFFRIDPCTGTASLIGAVTGSFIEGIGSLAYDPHRDRLFGNSEGFTDLYEINRVTAQLAQFYDGGPISRSSVAYDPGLDRIWSIDRSGSLRYYDFNKSPTIPVLNGLGDLEGLALISTVPETGSPQMVAVGISVLAALAGFRRGKSLNARALGASVCDSPLC